MVKVLAKRGGGRGGGRGARGAGRGGRGGALRGQGTGRGGVRAGGVADARQAILSKQRSGMVDARDKLVKMAKTGGDARKKLDKIRNLKAGKLEVKKRGGVTITTTTKGKLLLTTKKKEAASKKGNNPPSRGNLTRRVGRGGAISITTKKTPSVLKQQQQQQQQRRPAAAAAPARKTPASPGRGGGGRGRGARRPAPAAAPISPSRPITRTIKGELTESARLDEELLNTHVDPLVLKRTIRQQSSSRQAPPERRYVPSRMISEDAAYYDRRRDRSRSPMDYEEEGGRGRGSRRYDDFDDPRRGAEEDSFRRGMFRQSSDAAYDPPRTMADRLDSSSASPAFVSPLQGAKIQVSNLQGSVTQEDITELFGDIGPLKRSKLIEQGVAEVVFVNRADAQKAVEIYHNRQLDGKAMKCKLVGSGGEAGSSSSSFHLPKSQSSRAPPPEVGAIHKALFNEKPSGGRSGGGAPRRREREENNGRGGGGGGGTKPLFTVTMAKKGGSRY